jgi:Virulence factor
MPRRERGASEVVTIYWRDIPAQVNGQNGRERHQVLLSSKFQRAVDRAKRKAGIYTAEEDIAQWHRKGEPCDDHVLAAEAQAAALEAEYSKEYLGKLAYAGGFVADMTSDDVDKDELLALEELDDSDDTEGEK